MSGDLPDEPARVGRKRDPARDEAILAAAIEVLAEVGFGDLTMDLVAARAQAGKATLYRRWASKSELVLEAVARMKRAQVGVELPDTGTLRGDLLGMFKPQAPEVTERKLRIMAGLASMLSHDSALAEAASQALIDPWAEAQGALMTRAQARGEIGPDADIATLSRIIPSLAAWRSLIEQRPFTFEFLVGLVDGVVLPALGIPPVDPK